MNTFMEGLKEKDNYTRTDNGALAYKSTLDKTYDLFAFGGAYRNRDDKDCQLLFKQAYEEDKLLALKTLFYLRDIRGGQGERRFFRLAFSWLCKNDIKVAKLNLINIAKYGRWDDLWYATKGTEVFDSALALIKHQLALDVQCKTPSLLAKWLPSENASAYETKKMAAKIRKYLGMTHKQYRKTLSELRKRINVVEKLMSANEWDKIEFDKIPSRAGLIYKNAFARHDIIKKKYETFANNEDTKVNAGALYPYDIVRDIRNCDYTISDTEIKMFEKYWKNLPDYFEGKQSKILCVVDTSGSMCWSYSGNVTPIDVACSLGMYTAERCGGPFKDHFISFSSKPQLIHFDGVDICDKVRRCCRRNLCENTDLVKTFDLLKEIALKPETRAEDMPETIVVISDMQIDVGSGSCYEDGWTEETAATEMEKIRKDWEKDGLKMPKLVYWNVNASNNTILDRGDSVSFVSGCSPIIFESIMKGVCGKDLMLDKILSNRYSTIIVE